MTCLCFSSIFFSVLLQILREMNLRPNRAKTYIVTSGHSDQCPHQPSTPQHFTRTSKSNPTTPYHLIFAPYHLSLKSSRLTSHPHTTLPSRFTSILAHVGPVWREKLKQDIHYVIPSVNVITFSEREEESAEFKNLYSPGSPPLIIETYR